jgi:hypothetical protein
MSRGTHVSLTLFFVLAIPCLFAPQKLVADIAQNGVVIANDFGDFSATYDIGNLYDQSGLAANYVSGVTDFNSFVSSTNVTTNGNQNDSWFGVSNSANLIPGNVDFDLGATLDVTQVALWSFNGNDVNVWDNFTIFIDTDPGFGSAVNAGSFVFVNNGNGVGQIFDVTDVTGRYVRFRLTAANSSLVGMGEVLFGVGTGIPEPTSAALLSIACFGALASRRYRR